MKTLRERIKEHGASVWMTEPAWEAVEHVFAQAQADARRAGEAEGRRKGLEAAANHLKAQSRIWLKVAEDNQHRSDAASRAVAVELDCQSEIIRSHSALLTTPEPR